MSALVTVFFRVLVLAVVWGPATVLVGGVVVGFVLAVSVPVATVAGLSLTYARRRPDDGPSDGDAAR